MMRKRCSRITLTNREVIKMQSQPQATQKVFLSGVLLLTLSTILVKLIGFIYKIPMLSYLGSEGMGYFHSAYEIYAICCIVATAGLPIALSVLISTSLAENNNREAERIWHTALTLFVIIGFLGSAFLWILAQPICKWIQNEKALGCMIAISPTLFFVCLSSAIRGYFQGHQRMFETAFSQLLEALGKLIFGLLFVRFALAKGAGVAEIAAAAGWGVTAGTILSTLYLAIEKIRFRTKLCNTNEKTKNSHSRYVEKRLLHIALPITLGAFLISMTKVVDMSLILRRLQAIGYTASEANAVYGSYTTLAISVFALLPTLLNSIALPLVPILSSAIASHDSQTQQKMIELSYRINSLIALPASVGIVLFAHPILSLLFANQEAAVSTAAPLLSALGISIFLSCMVTATNSILHAYREVKKPIYATLLGLLTKGVTAYILIGIPAVGILGAPISSFLCNSVIVLLNMHYVDTLCHNINIKSLFVFPTLLSLAVVGISYGEYLLLCLGLGQNATTTLIPVATAIVLYVLIGCLLGMITQEDILALPCGNKICQLLERLRILSKNELKKTSKNTCRSFHNMIK